MLYIPSIHDHWRYAAHLRDSADAIREEDINLLPVYKSFNHITIIRELRGVQ